MRGFLTAADSTLILSLRRFMTLHTQPCFDQLWLFSLAFNIKKLPVACLHFHFGACVIHLTGWGFSPVHLHKVNVHTGYLNWWAWRLHTDPAW